MFFQVKVNNTFALPPRKIFLDCLSYILSLRFEVPSANQRHHGVIFLWFPLRLACHTLLSNGWNIGDRRPFLFSSAWSHHFSHHITYHWPFDLWSNKQPGIPQWWMQKQRFVSLFQGLITRGHCVWCKMKWACWRNCVCGPL